MANFYDGWLVTSERLREEFARSPGVARDRDTPWVQTRQDARVKLMLAPELGFPTMGNCCLKAEIPIGYHTGRHSHGEEAIHILKGRGFSVINGARYDWHAGTTLHIPYRAEHQHFNTGRQPALYLSAMCLPLEFFVKLGQVEQLEDAAPNREEALARIPPQTSQYAPDGRRIAIHVEDAPDSSDADKDPNSPNYSQHYAVKQLMQKETGFRIKSVAMTHIFTEPAGYHGGRHKHLEAMIYVLEGHGYSDVRGKMVEWEAGDVLHVPPDMSEHQHFNPEGGVDTLLLRMQFGIRYFFTDVWLDGYESRRIFDASGKPILAGRTVTQRQPMEKVKIRAN